MTSLDELRTWLNLNDSTQRDQSKRNLDEKFNDELRTWLNLNDSTQRDQSKRNLDEKFNDEINNKISNEFNDDVFNVEKNEITLINKKKKIMKKCEMKMIKKLFNFKIIKTKLKSKFKLKHHHKTVLSDEKKNFKKKTHFKKHQINNFSRNSFIILHNFHTNHYVLFNLIKQNVEHSIMSKFKSFNQYNDFTLYMNFKLSWTAFNDEVSQFKIHLNDHIMIITLSILVIKELYERYFIDFDSIRMIHAICIS